MNIDKVTHDALVADARGAEQRLLYIYADEPDIFAWEADLADDIANGKVYDEATKPVLDMSKAERLDNAPLPRTPDEFGRVFGPEVGPLGPIRDGAGYYSYGYQRVPFTGRFDSGAIQRFLYDRVRTSLTGTAVGGYSTPGDIRDNGDGTLTVQWTYHHGD